MIGDPELAVMARAYDIIKDLGMEERRRVIQWLTNKLGLEAGKTTMPVVSLPINYGYPLPGGSEAFSNQNGHGSGHEEDGTSKAVSSDLTAYSVQGLFDRIKMKTDVARVLLVASYLQEKDPATELGSRPINKELKKIGHGIKNITQAINSLLKKEPELLVMTRKTTSSQQGKKKYHVTDLGMQKAKEALKTGLLKV